MSKPVVALVLALLLAGCVSIGTSSPSVAPVATPTLGITTMAPVTSAVPSTAGPTSAPTASSVPPPTVAPTPTLAATATATSSPAAGPQLLFSDDFSDPGGACAAAGTIFPDCWGIGTTGGGTVGYVDGTLRFDTSDSGAWMWSRRVTSESWPLMQVDGVVVPSADGIFGLMCGTVGDELVGGYVSTTGGWAFITVDPTGRTVLSSDTEAGLSVPIGLSTEIGLACMGTDAGGLQLQLGLGDVGTVATYEGEGPANFDRAGLYVEALADGYSASFDNVSVFALPGGQMSAAAQEILTHVPGDWQATCNEAPVPIFETGAEASLSCSLVEPGANVVDYVTFDTQENMDAAYQARVDTWAADSTGSCQSGPNETSYTIGGSPAGRILCAPQTFGIRFDWTDDRLLILSALTDFESSYPDTYNSWLEAGPN